MGYDFHITRAESWIDSEATPIRRDEWFEFAAADPELSVDETNASTDPTMMIWSGTDENPEPWIAWENGRLYSKNAERALRIKMHSIAMHFGARLVGDDDEEYNAAGAQIGGSDTKSSDWKPDPLTRFRYWLFRMRRNLFR
ncbi:MAG: hypothetical protein RIB60_11705 [Phycisphaerales bacterium]